MSTGTIAGDSDSLEATEDPELQFKAIQRPSRRTSTSKKTETGNENAGPTIQDVTEELDRGYEADLDAAYPDDIDEPDSADESSSSSQLKQKRSAHASLLKQFRNLRFTKGPPPAAARHVHHRSHGSVGYKRSHSEDSLTDSDDVTSEAEQRSNPEHHQFKKRHVGEDLRHGPEHANFSTAMDIDPKSPTPELSSKAT